MPGRTKSKREATASSTSQDAEMTDAPPSAQPQAVADPATDTDEQLQAAQGEEEEELPSRVRILPGSTETAASFEFLEEGHTLGNALRYIIMKNPDVEFCAYAIPHPAEAKMNIRIQTYEGTAVAALSKGLTDLQELCDVVAKEFWQKRTDFMRQGDAGALDSDE